MTHFREVTKVFRRPGSDFLTAMNVLHAFRTCRGDKQTWCMGNFVNYKNLKDATELRKQLVQLLVSQETAVDVYASVADEEEVTLSSHEKKTQLTEMINAAPTGMGVNAEVVLRKLIVSGLIDNVARRATPEECALQKPPVEYNESGRRAPYFNVCDVASADGKWRRPTHTPPCLSPSSLPPHTRPHRFSRRTFYTFTRVRLSLPSCLPPSLLSLRRCRRCRTRRRRRARRARGP